MNIRIKNSMKVIKQLFILSIVFISMNTVASDLKKEARWADQVTESIMDGDAEWLNDGKSRFLGIYTEAEESSDRAVIVMHGTGIHPDWQQVIQPLRVGLTQYKWNTLSIQMPVLANDVAYSEYAPLYDEVGPRINAAIKYLRIRGIKNIVLLGHSQGSAMTAYYLTQNQKGISGFVAIGMAAFANEKRMNSVMSLEKINIPVLDLYGNDDLEKIINTSVQRADAAKKAGNKDYSQTQIPGDHFFDGEEENLISVVAKWMDRF